MKIIATLAIAAGVIWFVRVLRLPESPVRSTVRLTTVGVYCGNCANRWEPGREPRAKLERTFLTTDGRCSGCAGRSYVVASMYAPIVARRIQIEREPMESWDMPRSDARPREDRYGR